MPSESTLTEAEKAKFKAALPSHSFYFAAFARIYYAYPDPRKWSYAGLQGALVLCKDDSKGTFNFKMVDLEGTRGVLWHQELYRGLELNQDRAFFLSFEGDVCGSLTLSSFPL